MKVCELKLAIINDVRAETTKYDNWEDRALDHMLFVQPHSMRLTSMGVQHLMLLYEYYGYTHDIRPTMIEILAMSRYLRYPYFLSKNSLVFFNGEDAMMFKLCGEDHEKWISLLMSQQ